MKLIRFTGESAAERKLLLLWWHRLQEDDEFEQTFSPNQRSIIDFVKLMCPPTIFLYALDADRIVVAAWAQPVALGCSFGCWLERSMRRTEERTRLANAAFAYLFRTYPIILALVRPSSAGLVESFNFQPVGRVPEALTGTPSTVLYYLDKASFKPKLEVTK